MKMHGSLSRRSFLAVTAATPLALAAPAAKQAPIGLELYSVRTELAKDLPGTVKAVAKMGYKDFEIHSVYLTWTPSYVKEVKTLLDDLGVRMRSTHNGAAALTADNIQKAIDYNQTLGSKYIIMASAGKVEGLDGWKKVSDQLTQAADKLRPMGMQVGFHNHKTEFMPIEGKRPMEVLATNTPKDVILQLDVGTSVEAQSDPVAWIKANPGRIKIIHCKDWKQGEGYHVLTGEGASPWPQIVQAAESVGGVEFYLIEQEGSSYPPLETVERCLANWKKMRAAS